MQNLKIDFVSDVACPWCAVGLSSLQVALQRLQGEVQAEMHFQPFELNPDMGPEGEEVMQHLSRKYGAPPQQLAQTQQTLRERGAEVGFAFGERGWVWNTFDAHRLLHWAGLQGDRQPALKQALLQAYHGRGENVGDAEVLARAAVSAGLDEAQARQVIADGRYAEEVRAQQRYWQQAGIRSVPAVIVNDRHLIAGGQPPEVFEQALRQIAAGEVA